MQAIITRVHSRQERWLTERMQQLPSPFDLKEDAILGSFSYALQSSRKRLLRSDVLLRVDGTSDTPPSLARDYLLIRHKKARGVSWPQLVRIKEEERPMPLYAQPQRFSEGYYIDIRGAYWSIMQVIGWKADYFPGRWLGRGEGVRDFPYQEDERRQKIARVSLVSSCRPSKVPRWSVGTQSLQTVSTGNPLINMQLFGAVRDVLNAIAWEARAVGAIYVATDGYIAPTYKKACAILEAIDSWGLKARVKGAGPGLVAGAGCYHVGELHTARPTEERLPVDTMKASAYDGWLKGAFGRLAAWQDVGD